MNNPYADIIDLPHHVSQMPIENVWCLLLPYPSMTMPARFTEEKLELAEDETAVIDENLQWIREHIKEQPEVTVTYFQPDEKKNGGAYVSVTGSAKRVNRVLILWDGTVIPIDDVISLEVSYSV